MYDKRHINNQLQLQITMIITVTVTVTITISRLQLQLQLHVQLQLQHTTWIYNMQMKIIVEEEKDFNSWMAQQTTFAEVIQ